MIDDIVPLKKAMEEMDAEDPEVAQAAKERAAQVLSDAKLSFSKLAELIEQRRLLLRPRIVTGIKRMDQPGMLGDAAFRDAGSALRREGQSFGQIAEAIELTGRVAPRYENLTSTREPLRQMAGEPLQMGSEPLYDTPVAPGEPGWRLRALFLVASIVLFPLRHPIRFLAIALVALVLYYAFPGVVPHGRLASGYSNVVSTVRQGADTVISFLWRPKETTAPTPAAPIPSPSAAALSPPSAIPPAAPSTGSAPPAAAPTPSANTSAPPAAPAAPPSAAPAGPPVSTPRRDAKREPHSKPPANCCVAPEDRHPRPGRRAPYEDDRAGVFDDIIPEGARRNSRVAGPCVAGVGGCAWGGGRY